ncbi:MAG: ATP phosphoribosyltransferase regulatory subunit [Halieaceae bacterium]
MPRLTSAQPWQLPDGIDELLPEAAAHVEALRRELLACAARWGYQLVMPPLAEFTDSLLVGVGEDLDLLTFKVPDQLTGRMLGLRADITPQVARMDAHSMGGESINRLCYAGTTLHTHARSLAASRSPLQLGAELYGDASLAADIEVIDLMLAMLDTAGIAAADGLTLDLGHGDIFGHVLAACQVPDDDQEAAIFGALQRKSRPDLEPLLASLPEPGARWLDALLDMHGGLDVLDRAEALFADEAPVVSAALAQLRELASALQRRYPGLQLYIDLAELRGYHYHTGVVFAVYAPGLGEALARGGRYDNVGAVYGRARPATGFATDLRLLAGQVSVPDLREAAIAAPCIEDAALLARIGELRSGGETVIVSLGGIADPRCTRELTMIDGHWQLQPMPRTVIDEG